MASALLLAGCFSEGAGDVREASARTMVDSMIAFADIQANLTSDPAAAGEGLARFVKAPVAASELLDSPVDGGASASAARATRPTLADVPGCLDTEGEAGCDGFETNATCEAGGFTFTGTAARDCDSCDPTAACTYTWDLDLGYETDELAVQMNTVSTGVTVDADAITFDTTFDFELTSGDYERTGDLRVCSCGPINFSGSGEDLEVTSSAAVVKDLLDDGDAAQRCALVEFDANGDVSVSDACSCPSSDACD